ncbi:MAG: winged helix DNA-binding domain-containing protein [Deinococcus sp.]|nr:winged helix DNA-binding domain-containing protein [Deinococcus sp.]
MRFYPTNARALRRLLLARQGLLAWTGGKGRWREGVPWREKLQGTAGTLEALRRLEAVQMDPVNVLERNHHLVFMNRVGGYQASALEKLYQRKKAFEYFAQMRCLLPLDDYALFAPRRKHWAWKPKNRQLSRAAEYIRERLKSEGALASRALDLGDSVRGYWGFSAKATTQALEHLWEAGEVVVAFRKADERYFALAEDWLPAHLSQEGDGSNWEDLLQKYLRAYTVFDAQDARLGWSYRPVAERRKTLERLERQGRVTPLEVEGVKRRYYTLTELLPMLESMQQAKAAPEVFLLSPLDNLMWRRERVADLFGFHYRWEIYLPDHKRKYGPYVLPVLEGDKLVARVDARLNRTADALEVRSVWWEQTPAKPQVKRLETALQNLAANLSASLPGRQYKHLENH